jgi:hypothetical protein
MPQKGSGIDRSQLLLEFFDHLGAGGFREPFELVEVVVRITGAMAACEFDSNQNGLFLITLAVGAALLQD